MGINPADCALCHLGVARTVNGMTTTSTLRPVVSLAGTTVTSVLDAADGVCDVLANLSDPSRDALVSHLVIIFATSNDHHSLVARSDLTARLVRCAPHDFAIPVLARLASCSPSCQVRVAWSHIVSGVLGPDIAHQLR